MAIKKTTPAKQGSRKRPLLTFSISVTQSTGDKIEELRSYIFKEEGVSGNKSAIIRAAIEAAQKTPEFASVFLKVLAEDGRRATPKHTSK